MQLALGTEPRSEYMAFELGQAAVKLVRDVFPIKAGENVVVTADTTTDARVVNATAQAVYAVGAHPVVIHYEALPNVAMMPPAPVAAALKAADAWIEYAPAYLLHGPAHREAMSAGCRMLCLTAVDADAMVRTIGRPDYMAMDEFREKIRALSQSADEMRLSSPAGTDLTAKVDHDAKPFFRPASGKGYSQMLGGQSGFSHLVDTVEGTLVFDGTIYPPTDLGVPRTPVSMQIEHGYIRRVSGGSEASRFERWLASFNNPLMYQIAHLSYGFNPGVTRCSGRIAEDERVFGCLDIGIGITSRGAPTHTDGIVLDASVWADHMQLEDEGRYVHPELAALCKRMGAPGY